MTDTDNLAWLHGWYQRHCDGRWEHTLGLRLDRVKASGTAKQPACGPSEPEGLGWQLTIELPSTWGCLLRPRSARLKTIDGGWLHCSLTSERFTGTCDSERLEQVLGVFRRWMEHAPSRPAAPARLGAEAARLGSPAIHGHEAGVTYR